jgi:hypothetical protein
MIARRMTDEGLPASTATVNQHLRWKTCAIRDRNPNPPSQLPIDPSGDRKTGETEARYVGVVVCLLALFLLLPLVSMVACLIFYPDSLGSPR